MPAIADQFSGRDQLRLVNTSLSLLTRFRQSSCGQLCLLCSDCCCSWPQQELPITTLSLTFRAPKQSPYPMAAFKSAAAPRYQAVLRMFEVRYLGPRIGAVDPLLSFKLPLEMSDVQRKPKFSDFPIRGDCLPHRCHSLSTLQDSEAASMLWVDAEPRWVSHTPTQRNCIREAPCQ